METLEGSGLVGGDGSGSLCCNQNGRGLKLERYRFRICTGQR